MGIQSRTLVTLPTQHEDSACTDSNYCWIISIMNLIKYTDVLKTVPAPLTEKVD